MRASTAPQQTVSPINLPKHTCPACGMPAPAAPVILPSGRRAPIEACAICDHQEVTPVDAQQATMLLDGRDMHGQAVYGCPA